MPRREVRRETKREKGRENEGGWGEREAKSGREGGMGSGGMGSGGMGSGGMGSGGMGSGEMGSGGMGSGGMGSAGMGSGGMGSGGMGSGGMGSGGMGSGGMGSGGMGSGEMGSGGMGSAGMGSAGMGSGGMGSGGMGSGGMGSGGMGCAGMGSAGMGSGGMGSGGDGERRDGERRDGERGNGERRDGERRDGERRDGERGDGERRDGERGNGERRDGERRDGERRDGERGDGERRDGERGNGERRDGERGRLVLQATRRRGGRREEGGGREEVDTSSVVTDVSTCKRPWYYFRAGTGGGKNMWLIYLPGGGWCGTAAQCVARSKTLYGTSTLYPTDPEPNAVCLSLALIAPPLSIYPSIPPHLTQGALRDQHAALRPPFNGILSSNSTINPPFYNWNLVRLIYCDGCGYSGTAGRLEADSNGTVLYLDGRNIVRAVIEDLKAKGGITSAAQILLSGSSAGGQAVVSLCDRIAAAFPWAPTKCIADAGFFIDSKDRVGGYTWRNTVKDVVALHKPSWPICQD
ncbi:unnamed protein product, partial [Closterium sp. NIES-64]